MQSIFARGVYLGENTSQSASVEFVRPWRTNYARSRLQAFCPKWASPILDSGKSAGIVRYRRFCYRGKGEISEVRQTAWRSCFDSGVSEVTLNINSLYTYNTEKST